MQIPTLSNRTIAFFLLGLMLVLAYWGIRYVFFMNIGTLRLQVLDGSTYSVILKRANVEMSQVYCTVSCTFEKIPAGNYEYTATATGRLAITKTVNIPRDKIVIETLEGSLDVQASEAINKKSDATYEVLTNPIRLIDTTQDRLVLTSSASAVGYSLESMPYGFFLMFDPNMTITTYELSTQKTRLISWDLEELPTHMKQLANGSSFVLYTKNSAYLSNLDTGSLEEIKFYDDIEASPNGSVIALIRSTSTQKRQRFNLENHSGDALLDISRAGSPKVLQANVTDVDMLYWDGAYGVQKSNGDRQILNIK